MHIRCCKRNAFVSRTIVYVKPAVKNVTAFRENDIVNVAEKLIILLRLQNRIWQPSKHLARIIQIQQSRAGSVNLVCIH